jgi:dipeptidyl aminopeptidase/acylaminoacyl peptidase
MKANHVILMLLTTLLAIGCGSHSAEDVAAGPSQTYTMEQFMKTVSIGGGSFNPDETKLLISSNATGVYNVFVIDIASGETTAITEGEDTTFAIGFFPEDERILFTRDQAGNELNHIYLRDVDGTVTDLTRGDETKEQFFGWSYDLKSFFTLNNSRDPRFFDLYQWSTTELEPTMLYRNETGMTPAAISPNARWVALSKINTTNDSNLFILDLAKRDGRPLRISEHEGDATFNAMEFSNNGTSLYYTTNLDGEFQALKKYNLENSTHEDVFSTNWDVGYASFSRNDTFRVIGTNEDGYTKVAITRTATGEDLNLPALPEGTITGVGFSRSENALRLFVSSDTMPGNLFVVDLGTNEAQQLTDTLNPEINTEDLVESSVERFTARDGMTIPGPLYKPLGAGPDHQVPVLIWVHGGPGGQSRAGYSAERQFLLNHGYGIYAVNNRGSSGYGKTFFAADDGKHGREPLWDCIDAKEHLKTLDWVDPERIGIIGGSYGGYMTLAALAFEPEEFAVGVDLFGVSNWVRTLKSIPPYWESFREALYREIGNPETDEQFLYDTSPVFHGDTITKPLIIFQGANDPRVIQAESDDMVAAIKANGGIVEYVVFADEGHGFTKNVNRIKGWNTLLAFLDTYLKGAGTSDSVS